MYRIMTRGYHYSNQ